MYDFFSIPGVYIICETSPDQQKSAKHDVIMYGVWGGSLENLPKLNYDKIPRKTKEKKYMLSAGGF